ncbi:MAG: DUF5916 domain-containing protein [Candidatus Baltobacteraceae bacterium]
MISFLAKRIWVVAGALVVLCGASAGAQAPDTAGTITVPKAAATPPIDGDASNPAWKDAAKVTFGYDLRLHKMSENTGSAMIMTDGQNLYIAFDVKQYGPITAVQHSNNVGLDTDDEVQVDLWPAGSNGFKYLFISTPLGNHYQFSSENNSYEPNWESVGKLKDGGYSVTMRIPLKIMRGAKGSSWRVQFSRQVQYTHEDIVWNYGPSQGDHNDLTYAGFLAGMPRVAATMPKPRLALYGLAQAGPSDSGANTSRSGADLAVPLTSGTSFIGTFHPDFSNVESDQQSIAPTAFRRSFDEMRPFFTQGAQFYNPFSSVGYYVGDLYTPAIPTPRQGYAIEGKEGLFSLAAFDAVGFGRNDSAQVLTYHRPDRKLGMKFQRVAVDLPGLKDDVVSTGVAYDNLKDKFGYATYGSDSGTFVKAGDQAQRYELGGGYYGPTWFLGGAIRKLGAYYSPYDGYVQNSDVAGYTLNGSKDILFAKPAKVRSFSVSGFFERYHAHGGGLAQGTFNLSAEVTTYTKWRFHAETGAAYLLTGNGNIVPITQNYFSVTYHDTTSTPTQVSLSRGRWGASRLDSWYRTTTMRAGRRGTISLRADDTVDYLDNGQRYTQWFEKAAYAYQLNSDSSFAIGVRKITGTAPILSYQQPSGLNISAAYHTKFGPWELYAAYGNANATNTAHDFLIKLIRYVGNEKGT